MLIFGDDFMRSLVSFTMFDADHSSIFGNAIDIINIRFFQYLSIPFILFMLESDFSADKRTMFCESGQTIRKVHQKINDRQYLFTSSSKYVIVNLGALDILIGRNITDIKADYARLIVTMRQIGLIPIITTLPPIKLDQRQLNCKEVQQSLLLFNSFLEETFNHRGFHFIDLWRSFLPVCNNFYQV